MSSSNQLQLVTFEQAKRLKKAGFNWPCLRYYFIDGGYLDDDVDRYEYNWNSPDEDDLFKRLYGDSDEMDVSNIASAPTVALALKWIRDVKKIDTGISIFDDDRYTRYETFFVADQSVLRIPTATGIGGKYGFDTYDTAESALLDELLTLIENGNA